MQEQEFKRHIAYKLRVGQVLEGKPTLEADRFKFLEHNDKKIVRVNIIANIIDKYVQEGEKKFASVTLDDASGQIKAKLFGEDVQKFANFSQGDTILVIGLLRSWNNEVYITPEIIKKRSPEYLVVRKLEIDSQQAKIPEKSEINRLREDLLSTIKEQDSAGGAEVDKMILNLKSSPDVINNEIRKLLEEGLIYEPRPGRLRYLG